MTNIENLLKLIKENPNLPIVPLVDSEIVADDCYTWWLGGWGNAEIKAYYQGREHIHFDDDDEENVLNDLVGCRYSHDPEGRDIYDLSDEEWDALYKTVPWVKAIMVHITTP